ncbi:restriction endonuclease subunit S [Mucilaginibacter sp.]|uniref:restriction endonuclease subunit S n=1 Tax=Mucilaginibacter sp. TaxID=1882438 RepID=UPI003D13087F
MKWDKVEIGDIAKVISGFAFKSNDFKQSGVPVIKIKNIKDENVNIDEGDCVDSNIEVQSRFHLNDGDILISLTGSHITLPSSVVGRVARYRHETISYLNQRAGKFINIDKSRCIDDYLYYFLLQKETLTRIALKAQGGANQANISPRDVEGVEMKLPSLLKQFKVASILSAYDDLIKNNQKRIKLLEEKAQLHYKELVQDISFNKTEREEYLKDCLSFYIGGGWGEEEYSDTFTKPAYVIRGTDIPFIKKGQITDIPFRYHKESNLASRQMQPGDIVFEVSGGSKGQPIGRSTLITEKNTDHFGSPVICASFCKMLRVNTNASPEFFYLYLLASRENGIISRYEKHSASNIVNYGFEEFIREQKITLPKENELRSFTEQVAPIFNLISVLGQQNAKLKEARDIILPKLMNGELAV